MDSGRYIEPRWVINRCVDVLFIVDMILIFHLAYQEKADNGGHWVMNRSHIARHYLCGWFTIDLLSVLPFWALTLNYFDPCGPRRREPPRRPAIFFF